MKRNNDSLIGATAFLAAATLIAFFGPDTHRDTPPEKPKSDEDVSPSQALASGRGRRATEPTHIPLKGWKDILWRTYEQIGEDRLLADVVYDEKEKRGFVNLNAVSLTFTIGGVVAILTAGALVIVAPVALQMIGMGSQTELLIKFGRWPALAILLLLALAVLYRYAPSRRSPKWRWISVGSVVATLTWMVASELLSYYLSNFGHYDATYGSLGAAIALMIWMWMSTIVILFGAELNSEIEHQTSADSTTGPPKPLGDRAASMADTVGAGYPS